MIKMTKTNAKTAIAAALAAAITLGSAAAPALADTSESGWWPSSPPSWPSNVTAVTAQWGEIGFDEAEDIARCYLGIPSWADVDVLDSCYVYDAYGEDYYDVTISASYMSTVWHVEVGAYSGAILACY
jgi:hypothetical protein